MLSVLHSQYHACWCSGDLRSQGISRHGIDSQSWNIQFPASEELKLKFLLSLSEIFPLKVISTIWKFLHLNSKQWMIQTHTLFKWLRILLIRTKLLCYDALTWFHLSARVLSLSSPGSPLRCHWSLAAGCFVRTLWGRKSMHLLLIVAIIIINNNN